MPNTKMNPETTSAVTQYPMMALTPNPAIANAGSAQKG